MLIITELIRSILYDVLMHFIKAIENIMFVNSFKKINPQDP